jgi:hypothetical protein
VDAVLENQRPCPRKVHVARDRRPFDTFVKEHPTAVVCVWQRVLDGTRPSGSKTSGSKTSGSKARGETGHVQALEPSFHIDDI